MNTTGAGQPAIAVPPGARETLLDTVSAIMREGDTIDIFGTTA